MTIERAASLSLTPDRNPIDGTFELTVRCNLNCKMCLFRHDDSENPALMEKELTAVQWIQLAKQVADAGTMSLLITGGEPMLRPDFCEIWEGIYRQGFLITLYTNATLVTDRVMDTLKKYPPHTLGITVYGSNAETYEQVTGSGAAFERMKAGVHRLMTLPSNIQFRTTIIKDNLEDLPAIERLVTEEFHYSGTLQQPRCLFPPVRGGTSRAREVRLTPEENVRLFFRRGLEDLKEAVGAEEFDPGRVRIEAVNTKSTASRSERLRLTLFGCNAGMQSYAISWDGKLLGCQTMGAFFTDAAAEGFARAWERYPYTVQLPEVNKDCRDCSIADYCESCYASRYAETGTLNGYSEYACRDAHEIVRLVNGGKLI